MVGNERKARVKRRGRTVPTDKPSEGEVIVFDGEKQAHYGGDGGNVGDSVIVSSSGSLGSDSEALVSQISPVWLTSQFFRLLFSCSTV